MNNPAQARQVNEPAARKPIRRTDYQPPAFGIERVALWFDLAIESTDVEARLQVQRTPQAQGVPLRLDGERLQLLSISVDGRELRAGEFEVDESGLTIRSGLAPSFVLTVRTRLQPQVNSELLGLYVSSGTLLTQCEAQGFRRITYFADRPDVLARYTVCLRADRNRLPVLLSNGNLVEQGNLPDGRHFATWDDPHPKPSYLFALVAGRLQCRESRITTRSGRAARLQLWAAGGDLARLEHAQHSLERAIAWDEMRFGLELDLDRYMIVAVRDFNFGAMENKGLNLFSTRYVLADPTIATDGDFAEVEAVVGHEYFHNWTGNRVTCRDWFQLCLKEGLTVYREQEFVRDMLKRGFSDPVCAQSASSVPRIDAVRTLRTSQFAEDAGPMAHPVRPDSYLEINNFYTPTIYRKGAELIRMLATLIGESAFSRGFTQFIARHDGRAVTCEDFIESMAGAAGRDLRQFMRWYEQAGTPRVAISPLYDDQARSLELTFVQSCPATPGQADKEPFVIPLAIGLLALNGAQLPLKSDPAATGGEATRLLELTEPVQTVRLFDVPPGAVPSLLRDFSAPVIIDYPYSDTELTVLARHDPDPCTRWDAVQRLLLGDLASAADTLEDEQRVILRQATTELIRQTLVDPGLAPAYRELALRLPAECLLAEMRAIIVPDAVRGARIRLQQLIGKELQSEWTATYRSMQTDGAYQPDPVSAGRRALKNLALEYLVASADPSAIELARRQLVGADNLSDRYAALTVLVNCPSPAKAGLLLQCARDWHSEPLLMNKWFNVQATAIRFPGEPPVLERVRTLLRHSAYSEQDPQAVEALVVAYCSDNPAEFHLTDGSGYAFWLEQVLRLDAVNPIVAARVARALNRWRRYAPDRQQLMRQALQEVAARPSLSADVREVVDRALAA
ncbi:MAG TPA: aminopeptidase N [Burkholderiaceae bacterium]